MDDLNLNVNSEEFEPVIVDIESIASDPNQRIYVILTDEYKKCMYEVNNYEASMISFVLKELHKFSHIPLFNFSD